MPLSINTQVNSNGVNNLATGNMTSDAAAAVATTFTLGFNPRVIRFINLTDRITDEWYLGMTSPGSIKTAAAGTQTLETTNGITVSGNTFTVPAGMLIASKVFVFVAYA